MAARKPTAGGETWDAFWAEVSNGDTTVIRGVEVPVPTDVQLRMLRRLEDLHDSQDQGHIAELVSLLFSQDVYSEWEDAGMGATELKTVLAWGMANARGQKTSFADALALVQAEEDAGKTEAPTGPNRAKRRAAQTSRSAAGGGQSKRTSSASTGSARTRSRS